jgi:arabinan endo-1,5-alpha-L-arabinosidase
LAVTLIAPIARAADSFPAGEPTNSTARLQRRGPFFHDPSTIAKCGTNYWVFSTGPGIVSWHSPDLRNWEAGPRAFTSPPAWTTNVVPGFRGYFWAPDLLQLKGRYFLYYSVSTWGRNKSAIGLATNPTLDPTDKSYAWTDEGIVVQSIQADPFNAIDPSVMRAKDNTLWLAFGSFWSGIKLVQLDPETGKRISPDSTMSSLAYHDSIEAACIWQQGAYYYLFVNWGLCCRGTNSTYNIRLGRSTSVTGPYRDRDGKDMLEGGGTLFLGTAGNAIGPGHAGIFSEGDTNWFSCHFYDATRKGLATLSVRQLQWTADGWPLLQASLSK